MSVLATEALQVHPVALEQDLVGAEEPPHNLVEDEEWQTEGREEIILDGWVKVVLKEFPSNTNEF